VFSFHWNGVPWVALAAGAMLASIVVAQAAVAPPIALYSTPEIQAVGCAVGAHIGPLGACIGGDHRDHHRHCRIDDRGERVCR
jgi:hypothetical protein